MTEKRDVTALPLNYRSPRPLEFAALDDPLMFTTAEGCVPPQRELPCGCWQTEIMGMDGEPRWIFTILACSDHNRENAPASPTGGVGGGEDMDEPSITGVSTWRDLYAALRRAGFDQTAYWIEEWQDEYLPGVEDQPLPREVPK